MQIISQSSTPRAWVKAIAQPATEFPLTPLPVLSGKIPQGLRGTLYRNGPARLERGGKKVGHWFDGDGAILAVHFNSPLKQQEGEAAKGVYRYVKTAGYLAESEAGKFLYPNYGMTASGPFWNQWLRPVKNAANTSVLALPDKLLALWEGGHPHALDLETLETWGLDDLGGLEKGLPYSAHPKRDPRTGEIFNFGQSLGATGILNVYKSDRTGKIIQKAAVKLDGVVVLHDFVLAGPYLIFCIPPARINLLPVLLGLSSIGDAMKWQPNLGTQIWVFDRETLSLVSRGEAEPWYQWHFGNACVDADGSVLLDLVRYRDFQTNQRLKEVPGGETQTDAEGSLWQMRLDPKTGKIAQMQQVLNRACEFPSVSASEMGQPWRYTYVSLYRKGTDIIRERYDAIARFDYQTGNLTEADLGENRYPSEPIYAPDTDNPNQGWILTVVYDANSDSSEVWVFDSDRLDESPVCRLGLPAVVPLGFHGTWKSA